MGNEHSDTLIAVNSMGILLQSHGKLSEAELYFREAVEGFSRTLGKEHFYTLVAIDSLGRALIAANNSTEAAPMLVEAEPAARRTFTSGQGTRLGRFLTSLGRARMGTKEFEAAEANLAEAHAILSESKSAAEQDRTNVMTGLVELYEVRHAAGPDKGYSAKASEWRTRLHEASPAP